MIKVITKENMTECEICGKKLAYEDADVTYGAFGCGEITCPNCGEKVIIEDKNIELTANNIEYPKHFAGSENAIKIPDKDIIRYVRESITYMDTH